MRSKTTLGILPLLASWTLVASAQSFIHYNSFAGIENAAEVVKVPGDGYYWVGYTDAYGSDDILVIKYDAQGRVLWSYAYDFGGDERARGAYAVSGGGVVIAGELRGPRDGLALYIDANGNVVFAKVLQGNRAVFNDVIQHSNGDFYFVGQERVGREEVIVVRIAPSGTVLNYVYYSDGGINNLEFGFGLRELASGDIAVVGSTDDGGTDDWLLFTINPNNLSIVNGPKYLRSNIDNDFAYDVVDDNAGNLYVVGEWGDNAGQAYPAIAKLRSDLSTLTASGYFAMPGGGYIANIWYDAATNMLYWAGENVYFGDADIALGQITPTFATYQITNIGKGTTDEVEGSLFYDASTKEFTVGGLTDFGANRDPFIATFVDSPQTLRCGYRTPSAVLNTGIFTLRNYTLTAQNGPSPIVNLPLQTRYAGVSTNACYCPINADFATTANPYICTGATADFTYLGDTLGILNYQWNFGADATPTTSNVRNPSGITYATAGSKTVTLTVSDAACSATVTKGITVHETPAVSFTVSDAAPCEGEPVDFTNTGSTGAGWTYSWDFDVDAVPQTSSDENPTGVYWTSPGAKTVTFTISSAYCSNSTQMVINVQDKPVADFSAPARVCQGDTAVFDFTGEALAGATYTWTLDGGTPGTATGPSAQTVFGPTEWRDVKLVVVNTNGCADSIIKQVYVDSLPDVQFTVSNPQPCEGEPVNFTNTGTSGPGWTYSWTFGTDANPHISSDENPANVYWTSPGAKTVTLTISSAYCSNTNQMVVNVQDKPVVDFTAPTRVCQGDTVSFVFTGYDTLSPTYAWYIDGGTPTMANTPNVESVFGPTGWHDVKLVVTNNNGCVDSLVKQVLVDSTPVVSFASTAPVCAGQPVDFTNTGTQGPEWNYSWDFGPGATPRYSTQLHPSGIIYHDGGQKLITLQITNNYTGCSAVDTASIQIWDLPVADAGPIDTTICFGTTVQLGTPAIAGYTYSWTPTESLDDPTAAQPIANPDASLTIYHLVVTDANGCQNRDSIIVYMLDPLRVEAGPDVEICYGDTIQLSASFDQRYAYVWRPGYAISDSTTSDPYVWPDSTLTYTVIAIDTSVYQCGSVSDQVTVTVHPLPDAKITPKVDTIARGEQTQLVATGGVQYEWYPMDGLDNAGIDNPIASPDTTTTYVVKVTDVYGCVNWDTAVVYVRTPEVWIPKAFSPNGDGLNDDIGVEGFGFVRYDFRVYDRLGGLVFRSTDPGIRWKGENMGTGQPCPEGAYVYKFIGELSDGQTVEMQGIINLIR